MRRWIVLFCLLAGLARAEGEPAGVFDHYVLALSWTPNWCAREGDARDAPNCASGQGFGFTLHGLWPQYAEGWPSFCPTAADPPPRSMTAAQADLFGAAGLAWHQWRSDGGRLLRAVSIGL